MTKIFTLFMKEDEHRRVISVLRSLRQENDKFDIRTEILVGKKIYVKHSRSPMSWVKIWLWRVGMVQVWGQVNLGCLYVPPVFLNLCQDYQVNVFWECRNGTLNSHHPKAKEAIWDLQQRLYCFALIWLCDILTSVVSYTTVTEFVLGQFPAVI